MLIGMVFVLEVVLRIKCSVVRINAHRFLIIVHFRYPTRDNFRATFDNTQTPNTVKVNQHQKEQHTNTCPNSKISNLQAGQFLHFQRTLFNLILDSFISLNCVTSRFYRLFCLIKRDRHLKALAKLRSDQDSRLQYW